MDDALWLQRPPPGAISCLLISLAQTGDDFLSHPKLSKPSIRLVGGILRYRFTPMAPYAVLGVPMQQNNTAAAYPSNAAESLKSSERKQSRI